MISPVQAKRKCWLTKSCQRWSLASETTQEVATSTKILWRLVLKNSSYYANASIVTVLTSCCWGYFRLFRVKRDVLGLFSFGHASVFYTALFTSSALTRGTAWEKGPCRPRALQVAKKSHNKTSPIQIWARVDSATQECGNFLWVEISWHPGEPRKTKISTPRK